MAYALGPKGTSADKRIVKFEEFVSSSGWTEDASSHYLLVDLPDFRQENIKLDVDDSGYITFSGERKISDLKYTGVSSLLSKSRKMQMLVRSLENSRRDAVAAVVLAFALAVLITQQTQTIYD